jgi:hypothetical protein
MGLDVITQGEGRGRRSRAWPWTFQGAEVGYKQEQARKDSERQEEPR